MDPSSGKKKAGRPTQDRSNLVLQVLRSFQKADGSSIELFGAEWKNVNRNWTSYSKDIERWFAECEDEEESDELVVLLRTLRAARCRLI